MSKKEVSLIACFRTIFYMSNIARATDFLSLSSVRRGNLGFYAQPPGKESTCQHAAIDNTIKPLKRSTCKGWDRCQKVAIHFCIYEGVDFKFQIQDFKFSTCVGWKRKF